MMVHPPIGNLQLAVSKPLFCCGERVCRVIEFRSRGTAGGLEMPEQQRGLRQVPRTWCVRITTARLAQAGPITCLADADRVMPKALATEQVQ